MQPWRVILPQVLVLVLTPVPAFAATDPPPGPLLVGGVAAFVLLLAGGLGWHAFALRRDFLRLLHAAPDQGAALFRDAPAGLPEGSVRAAIALAIVLVTLPALVLSRVLGLESTGELGTILGGVLGYYFGARGTDAEARRQIEALRTRAPDAPLTGLASHAADAAVAARTVATLLPDGPAAALRRAGDAAEAVGRAAAAPSAASIAAAAVATAGAVRQAVGAAEDAPASPLALLEAAFRLPGAAGALGAAGPAAGAVAVLLGAWQAARLGAAHHRRFVARVLDRPVTPDLFPDAPWDGEAARALIAEEPALAAALAAEIAPDVPQSHAAAALRNLLAPEAEQRLAGTEAQAALARLRRRLLEEALDAADGAPVPLGPGATLPPAEFRAALDGLREAGGGPALEAVLAQVEPRA